MLQVTPGRRGVGRKEGGRGTEGQVGREGEDREEGRREDVRVFANYLTSSTPGTHTSESEN